MIYQSFAATTTYYVDCSGGSDSANNGTSVSSPWRSLAKASTAPLTPGSQLLLKRGCTWSDQLKVGWSGTAASPIVVGAYGDSTLPVPTITSNLHGREMVVISGAFVIVEHIYTRGEPPELSSWCQNNPVGYVVGFALAAGANNNIVRNIKATGNYAGVSIKQGAHHNKVLNSEFTNNTMMSPLDPKSVNAFNDAGAFGIALFGEDNEIAGNTFNGHYACSEDYDGDGSAVEIYGGIRNHIHHNRAAGNEAFTELGHVRAADNTYSYNKVSSSIRTASFLITRGSDNLQFGPIYGTKAYHNSIYMTGTESKGIVCHDGCSSSVLSAKNNILWADRVALYADGLFDEGHNIYWKTGGNAFTQTDPAINSGIYPISSTSQKIDPKYVSALNLDFHLQAGSPAIDKGTNLSYASDLDGAAVPKGASPDVGAYEFGAVTTKQGDINNDNVVNIFDLSILLSNYGKSASQATDPDCDINKNGSVDIFDLSILLSKYGT